MDRVTNRSHEWHGGAIFKAWRFRVKGRVGEFLRISEGGTLGGCQSQSRMDGASNAVRGKSESMLEGLSSPEWPQSGGAGANTGFRPPNETQWLRYSIHTRRRSASFDYIRHAVATIIIYKHRRSDAIHYWCTALCSSATLSAPASTTAGDR